MTHVNCRLAAKNRDQLRHPTLGNRVWGTFTFLHYTVHFTAGRTSGCTSVNTVPDMTPTPTQLFRGLEKLFTYDVKHAFKFFRSFNTLICIRYNSFRGFLNFIF